MAELAAELPDRVLVYGVTGSGKSTAALAIGARTGHPVTLVDELTWLPGWVPVDGAVQRDLISEVVAGERWLLDSAYGAWLDLVLPHAELVVGLDYPRWLSLGRLVRQDGLGGDHEGTPLQRQRRDLAQGRRARLDHRVALPVLRPQEDPHARLGRLARRAAGAPLPPPA